MHRVSSRRWRRLTGNRPLFLPCDITDIPALQGAIARRRRPMARHGAGQQRRQRQAPHHRRGDEDFWDWSQAINLKAYFFACQAVVAGMRAAGGGSIINVSSISYMMGNAATRSYTTANGGITAMTRSLAREFGPDNIRVNALMPGWVLTDKQLEMWASPEDLAAHMDRMCLKEHLKPGDITGGMLVSRLVRQPDDDGQALVIDGGVVVTG
jgi:NAD(P)-dependent dehydrogenase (short-subunit alcohol dehydrogenase family)